MQESFSAILDASTQCLARAGLPRTALAQTIACLALAGASEPSHLAAARSYPHPFRRAIFTTDAHAACLGAHGERDGGIIIAGTGTVGWAVVAGRTHRVAGWGLPISDEGSGAWLGQEGVRRLLWALDGRLGWTDLLRDLGEKFGNDPHAIAAWSQSARPGDFGSLAPAIFEHAACADPVAQELVRRAAAHIDAIAARLVAVGAARLALVGGCAPLLFPLVSEHTRSHLVEPAGDALSGALRLAHSAAEPLADVA